MHPAHDGLASLPFFDEFDLGTVDVLLISQYVTPFPLLAAQREVRGCWVGFGHSQDVYLLFVININESLYRVLEHFSPAPCATLVHYA